MKLTHTTLSPSLKLADRKKRELHDLTTTTMEMLELGGFAGIATALRMRVFGRSTNELFETATEGPVTYWRFKPMVELLLRHMRDVVGQELRSTLSREAELREAIELAGF